MMFQEQVITLLKYFCCIVIPVILVAIFLGPAHNEYMDTMTSDAGETTHAV